MDDYARHFGFDPSKGPWVMVVQADGTTSFEVFENEDDMWCCKQRPGWQPQRVAEIQEKLRADREAGLRICLTDVVLTFDPKDRESFMEARTPTLPERPR